MPKHRRPAYYAAPLKSRKDIIGFLTGHEAYYRHHPSNGNSPLAWDVKAYSVDFDPDHLIDVYKRSGEYNRKTEQWLDYPEWREPAMAKYQEIHDDLWNWAVEDAQRQVTDDDTYRSLWKGDYLNVKYGFSGRSGGWLIMMEYEGADLTRMDPYDFAAWLEEMDYKSLRNLYELVVQNDHDFRKEAVKDALEFAAAWTWIENVCSDVPRPDKTQAQLPLGV